jgi:hypothetical protein
MFSLTFHILKFYLVTPGRAMKAGREMKLSQRKLKTFPTLPAFHCLIKDVSIHTWAMRPAPQNGCLRSPLDVQMDDVISLQSCGNSSNDVFGIPVAGRFFLVIWYCKISGYLRFLKLFKRTIVI